MAKRGSEFLVLFSVCIAACSGEIAPPSGAKKVGSNLETLIGDNFRTGSHQALHYLRAPDGSRTFISESDLSLLRALDGSSYEALSAPAPITSVHIGALLLNFRDDPSQPWTASNIKNDLFSGSESLAAYYHEVSYGRLKVTGEVLGWYQLPFNRPAGCNDMDGLLAQIISALPQVNFNRYTNILIGLPRICEDWDGFGTVGGIALPGVNHFQQTSSTSVAWVNGGQTFESVAIHEMGHNLGVHHANGCDDQPTATGCKSLEYVDPFDIMGFVHTFEKPRQMNSYHKEALGWFAKKNITIATQSGTYALAPLESASTAPQVIKIPRNGNSWYYLEFRQPTGFDSELTAASPATSGVSIRLAPMYLNGGDSHLVDTTLGLSRDIFDDAPLGLGQTFYDSIGKIEITTTRVSPNALSVAIVMTPSDPIKALPLPPPPAENVFCGLIDPTCQ